MINIRPKVKIAKKAAKPRKAVSAQGGLTAEDVSEINLFGSVIAKMNVRADERRKRAKAKA